MKIHKRSFPGGWEDTNGTMSEGVYCPLTTGICVQMALNMDIKTHKVNWHS